MKHGAAVLWWFWGRATRECGRQQVESREMRAGPS